MISWQALTLNGFLRLTLKRRSRKPIDLERLRHATRNPGRLNLAIPAGYRIEELRTNEGLNFDVADGIERSAAGAPVVVLYLHGGGYIFGSPKTHRQALIAMAKAFAGPVYGLDYRLAPEHPFPAAADDADRAYAWLLARHPDSAIVLAGDSAGGGLAIATAIGIRERGLRQAAAIVGFSAYADLAVTGESVEANARSCAMFTPAAVREAAQMYLAGANPRDPRASPLYADLSNLPPMLLFASRHEILRDDTLRLAARAKAAGVKVELVVRDRLPHVWPVFVSLLPEARDAFSTVASFARNLANARVGA
jgi:monoterpene epsilon-lactone hydrolase